MTRLLQCTVVAAALALLWTQPAAPAADESTAQVSVSELEDLAATIENDAERAKLVQRLRSLIEVKKSEAAQQEKAVSTLGSRLLNRLSAYSEELGHQLSALSGAMLALPRLFTDIRAGLGDPGTRQRWGIALLSFAAVVAAGLVAAGIARRLLKRPLVAVPQRKGDSVLVRIPLLFARLVLILVPPLAFAAAGWAAASLFEASSIARPIALSIIYAVAIAGAVNAFARTFLAPGEPAARPLAIGDETAQYLYIWVRRFSGLGIYGFFLVEIAGLLGLAAPAQNFLLRFVGLGLMLFAIMIILQNRRPVAAVIGGANSGTLATLRRRLADLWHVLAILYVVVIYFVWVAGVAGGFVYMLRSTVLSAAAAAAALLLVNFVIRGVDQAFSLSEDIKARLPGLEARVNRYLPVLKTVLRWIAWVITILAVLQAWGVDILYWLSQPGGRVLLARIASIGAIIVLALAGWEAISAVIERYLSSEDGTRSQRARTLLPLLRKVVFVVLTVMVGLTVLSELGISIGPLLAGAGVIGLAIGFGAQTLVRDIITGLFILLEDSVSVGDYVSLAGHGGTVEALSIRSIRLRDLSGTVHTIPFSDVTTVINYTRDFAYALLEIGIAYKEDVDTVSQIVESTGAELREDPDIGQSILEDLQLMGLDRFDDSAVVIKARIKTAPGMQWAVRRAYNRRLKQRFDAEGIEIPFPQRTVWFAGGSAGTDRNDEGATDDNTAKDGKGTPKAGSKDGPNYPAVDKPGEEVPDRGG